MVGELWWNLPTRIGKYLGLPGMQSCEGMEEEILQAFFAPKKRYSEEPATSRMEASRGRCLFYELSAQEEESIEDSVGAAHADPWPMDLDVAGAFLDAEDIEVNVYLMDPNLEFLEDKIEIALTQVNMSPRRPRRPPTPFRNPLVAAQDSTSLEPVGTECPQGSAEA